MIYRVNFTHISVTCLSRLTPHAFFPCALCSVLCAFSSRLNPHSCLTPHTSSPAPCALRFSLTSHASRLTPHTSCLTPHTSRLTPHYSYLSASTGFLVAALQLCQLIVKMAMPATINPAMPNIHQLNSVL